MLVFYRLKSEPEARVLDASDYSAILRLPRKPCANTKPLDCATTQERRTWCAGRDAVCRLHSVPVIFSYTKALSRSLFTKTMIGATRIGAGDAAQGHLHPNSSQISEFRQEEGCARCWWSRVLQQGMHFYEMSSFSSGKIFRH